MPHFSHMIADDDKVQIALAALADSGTPEAIYRLTEAETASDRAWAAALLEATGTVEEKKAKATISVGYQHAQANVAKAKERYEDCRKTEKWANRVIDIWEREKFAAWSAERVR